ncbi:porin [Reinekea blandensis]|uniref:OMPH_PHOPR Porin-like protein H n=1 Tax=Reinekea blandensis MED297 TaxID=314283 RepID=A4BA67_9GAMM|nr:porin [Reinekea blandensis]EAR10823.1 OMPH_PHOPR Porin-like protein H precursor [Reinekea sp. MED297] [Reinekea blandensis MED297]
MKKLPLSIAVSSIALAAAGVQAAETVYENEGLSLSVGADAAWVVEKSNTVDSDVQLSKDAADVNFKIASELNDDVTLFGYFSLDSGVLGDNYVGATYGATTLTVGKHATAADAFGIGKDQWFGFGNVIAKSSGDDVIKVAYEKDGISVAAATEYAATDAEDSLYDLYASVDLEGVSVAGFVQSTSISGADDTLFGASAAYSLDALTVGAEYSYSTETEVSALEVAGSYAATDKLTVAAGYGMELADANDEAPWGVYANASYDLTANASTFAEVAQYGGDGYADTQDDLGFAAGLSLSF